MKERTWLLFLVPVAIVVAVALLLPPVDPETLVERESVPTPEPRPTATMPEHPAFTANGDFDPMPEPGPMDWLSVHPEGRQTYDRFVMGKTAGTDSPHSTIELLPLVTNDGWSGPDPEILRRFTAAYFTLTARMQPSLNISVEGVTSRILEGVGPTARQILTGDLLDLLRGRRSHDSAALLGVTTEDLYPGDNWNFVFGEASPRYRVAVYSFARYDPAFWGEQAPDAEDLVLHRSLKVLAHETAHMFGIRHCSAYHCVMNGANHLDEADATPFHLCPIDLAKLHFAIGFDPIDRYQTLAQFFSDLGLQDEADWINHRLNSLLPRGG